MEVNNEKRADWAQLAVDRFRRACSTDKEDAIADLITNLLHLADREGFDPIHQLERGRMNYEAEVEEEKEMARLEADLG